MHNSNGNKTDAVQVKAGLAYWTDALSEAQAKKVGKAFERCAEELLGNGNNGLRVWMIMRRVG